MNPSTKPSTTHPRRTRMRWIAPLAAGCLTACSPPLALLVVPSELGKSAAARASVNGYAVHTIRDAPLRELKSVRGHTTSRSARSGRVGFNTGYSRTDEGFIEVFEVTDNGVTSRCVTLQAMLSLFCQKSVSRTDSVLKKEVKDYRKAGGLATWTDVYTNVEVDTDTRSMSRIGELKLHHGASSLAPAAGPVSASYYVVSSAEATVNGTRSQPQATLRPMIVTCQQEGRRSAATIHPQLQGDAVIVSCATHDARRPTDARLSLNRYAFLVDSGMYLLLSTLRGGSATDDELQLVYTGIVYAP